MLTRKQYFLDCLCEYDQKVRAVHLLGSDITEATKRKFSPADILTELENGLCVRLRDSLEMTFLEPDLDLKSESIELCETFVKSYQRTLEIKEYLNITPNHFINLRNGFIKELNSLKVV